MIEKVIFKPILDRAPKICVILGSGLHNYANKLSDQYEIPYEDIPNMPRTTAPGHDGKLILAKISGIDILLMKGRIHYYEGYSLEEVTYPIRLIHTLGIKYLLVTNASGGINQSFKIGDLMIIKDHINFIGNNPLIGRCQVGVTRFPDMSYAYDPDLIELMYQVAEKVRINLREGIYLGCSGPSYETPAEIRAFRILGADAVGMSTVPEVIMANALGIKTVGISCISNMAAGVVPQKLTETEVIETGEKVSETISVLISNFIISLQEQINE